jgi:hypothetical protein
LNSTVQCVSLSTTTTEGGKERDTHSTDCVVSLSTTTTEEEEKREIHTDCE